MIKYYNYIENEKRDKKEDNNKNNNIISLENYRKLKEYKEDRKLKEFLLLKVKTQPNYENLLKLPLWYLSNRDVKKRGYSESIYKTVELLQDMKKNIFNNNITNITEKYKDLFEYKYYTTTNLIERFFYSMLINYNIDKNEIINNEKFRKEIKQYTYVIKNEGEKLTSNYKELKYYGKDISNTIYRFLRSINDFGIKQITYLYKEQYSSDEDITKWNYRQEIYRLIKNNRNISEITNHSNILFYKERIKNEIENEKNRINRMMLKIHIKEKLEDIMQEYFYYMDEENKKEHNDRGITEYYINLLKGSMSILYYLYIRNKKNIEIIH